MFGLETKDDLYPITVKPVTAIYDSSIHQFVHQALVMAYDAAMAQDDGEFKEQLICRIRRAYLAFSSDVLTSVPTLEEMYEEAKLLFKPSATRISDDEWVRMTKEEADATLEFLHPETTSGEEIT